MEESNVAKDDIEPDDIDEEIDLDDIDADFDADELISE